MSSASKRRDAKAIDQLYAQALAFDLCNYWTCADGRMMVIAEMDEGHIRHCIAKIERNGSAWRVEFLPRLKLELQLRHHQRGQ